MENVILEKTGTHLYYYNQSREKALNALSTAVLKRFGRSSSDS